MFLVIAFFLMLIPLKKCRTPETGRLRMSAESPANSDGALIRIRVVSQNQVQQIKDCHLNRQKNVLFGNVFSFCPATQGDFVYCKNQFPMS